MSVQASRTFYVRKTASDITFSVSARERILHLRLEDRDDCVEVPLKSRILVLVKRKYNTLSVKPFNSDEGWNMPDLDS
jgi:hypothetical protein